MFVLHILCQVLVAFDGQNREKYAYSTFPEAEGPNIF